CKHACIIAHGWPDARPRHGSTILSRYTQPRHAPHPRQKESAGMADFDLAIVGGGINGTGIARDAAGRGLRVLLVEQNDLASGTSSASTKLIHGGLRYLEHGWLPLGRRGPPQHRA